MEGNGGELNKKLDTPHYDTKVRKNCRMYNVDAARHTH